MRKNNLSKDLLIEAERLARLKLKHSQITTEDDLPSHLDKAIEELRKGYIEAIIDEEIYDRKRVSASNQKDERKA